MYFAGLSFTDDLIGSVKSIIFFFTMYPLWKLGKFVCLSHTCRYKLQYTAFFMWKCATNFHHFFRHYLLPRVLSILMHWEISNYSEVPKQQNTKQSFMGGRLKKNSWFHCLRLHRTFKIRLVFIKEVQNLSSILCWNYWNQSIPKGNNDYHRRISM